MLKIYEASQSFSDWFFFAFLSRPTLIIQKEGAYLIEHSTSATLLKEDLEFFRVSSCITMLYGLAKKKQTHPLIPSQEGKRTELTFILTWKLGSLSLNPLYSLCLLCILCGEKKQETQRMSRYAYFPRP